MGPGDVKQGPVDPGAGRTSGSRMGREPVQGGERNQSCQEQEEPVDPARGGTRQIWLGVARRSDKWPPSVDWNMNAPEVKQKFQSGDRYGTTIVWGQPIISTTKTKMWALGCRRSLHPPPAGRERSVISCLPRACAVVTRNSPGGATALRDADNRPLWEPRGDAATDAEKDAAHNVLTVVYMVSVNSTVLPIRSSQFNGTDQRGRGANFLNLLLYKHTHTHV